MTTYYADFDLTTGDNDGSDAANAWKTLADVIAGTNQASPPTAGDTVLCKGTDTITSTVTITIDGTYDGGYFKLIGVNASWANDGTRFKIESSSNISLITLNGANYLWLENCELESTYGSGSATHGIASVPAYSDYCVFINCSAHGHRGWGFYLSSYTRFSSFIRCTAYSNTTGGFYEPRYCVIAYCSAHDNTGRGFEGYDNVFLNCISYDNSTDGFYCYGLYVAMNCVADGNGERGFNCVYSTAAHAFIGIRSTNNSVGISNNRAATTMRLAVLGYYGDNNTTDSEGYWEGVLVNGVSTYTLNGTDTDEGYTDQAANNYSLASGATGRRIAIPIPVA